MFAQRRTRSGREYAGIHQRRITRRRREAQEIVTNLLQDFISDNENENNENNTNNEENDNSYEYNANDNEAPSQSYGHERQYHRNHPHPHPGFYDDEDEHHRHRYPDRSYKIVKVPAHYRREPLF